MTKIAFIGFVLALCGAASTASAGGSGWGCRTCGYSNGTQLTGLAVDASGKPAAAIILASSAMIDAR